MVLKLYGEDIERNVDLYNKIFVWNSHGCFVGSSRINKLLLEDFHLKKHGFSFMGDG